MARSVPKRHTKPSSTVPSTIGGASVLQTLTTIRCPRCEHRLARDLVAIELRRPIAPALGGPYVPEGQLYRDLTDYWGKRSGQWALNAADLVGTRETTDMSRFVGCCGSSGLNGPNLRCANCGIYVATRIDDCLQAHCVFLEFSPVAGKGGT